MSDTINTQGTNVVYMSVCLQENNSCSKTRGVLEYLMQGFKELENNVSDLQRRLQELRKINDELAKELLEEEQLHTK